MTLFFPDVSEYTPNVNVAPYPIVLARATLSDRIADRSYATYQQRSAGKVFVAYHWLNHGNLAAQARWCFQHVGPKVPVMIDAEDESGNTGYNGPLTVDDLLGFAADYRSLGGIVSLVYLPFWYWSGPMGAPHRLGETAAAGLALVSSNYPNAGYTENGPGWAPYYPGAPAPVQWQYTSTPIDMNAFKGTVDDYAALVAAPQSPQGENMPKVINIVNNGKNWAGLADGFGGWQYYADIEAANEASAAFGSVSHDVPADLARRAYGIHFDANGAPMAPPPPAVTMTPADQQAIADLILAGMPKPPTTDEIAKAVNDDTAKRLQE